MRLEEYSRCGEAPDYSCTPAGQLVYVAIKKKDLFLRGDEEVDES